MSNAYFPGGAVERSATNEQNQELAKGCGPNRPIEAKSEIPAAPAPSVREKLRAIRDSDHPASKWARNVVQILDGMKVAPNNPYMLRALGHNVAMMERAMDDAPMDSPRLSGGELVTIFNLGTHQ